VPLVVEAPPLVVLPVVVPLVKSGPDPEDVAWPPQ
jgi:hypothetical protein